MMQTRKWIPAAPSTAQRTACALGLSLMLACGAAQAIEVAGTQVAEQQTLEGQTLQLNGAGLRSRFFIKVYVGALYASQKSNSAQTLIDSPTPRRMRLHILRELEADSFYSALDEGMRNNLSPAQLSALKPKIDQLGNLMRALGKVRQGDVIDLDFSSAGVALLRNNENAGKVAGADFAAALLKVWLGEQPADAALKKALLGN